MKNSNKNIIFNNVLSAFTLIFIIIISVMPFYASATSFVPTSRTYYPAGNTQPITIVNNNYNNNINNNSVPASAPLQKFYTTQKPSIDVDSIARNNLPNTQKDRSQRDISHAMIYGKDHVHNAQCGAKVEIAGVKVAKPTCTLVPAISKNGTIELQWTTSGATVAYIDNGIGHVNTVRGRYMIQPQKDTAYNLTVLNDAGIAGSCGARVNVSLAKAGEINVVATNKNYSYTLNGNNQTASVSSVDINSQTSVRSDTSNIRNEVTDTSASTSSEEEKTGGENITAKFFGDTFKKIAIPIGIVFLILIVLLVIIMSKVKAVK